MVRGDFVSREVTAIAARWVGYPKPKTDVWLLGDVTPFDMLEGFVALYDFADVVTGHYIRGFDLPIINSALVEAGLPCLSDKMTQDTKLDLVKRHGMSGSLENLASDFGLRGKVVMSQADWRDANRLTKSGLAKTRRRVVEDVDLTIRLRAVLLENDLLSPPSKWSSTSAGKTKGYTP